MTKIDEAFAQALGNLRAWMQFLQEREKELQEQLERARRKDEAAAAAPVQIVEEEEQDGAAAPAAGAAADGQQPPEETAPAWL
jgi:hypothetical protein